ncbi:hypothetical protein FHG87_018322, partial [Trinorchestia longiramus]
SLNSFSYLQFMLAEEDRYRETCPPVVVVPPAHIKLSSKIFCFWLCLCEPSCVFFTSNIDNCSLWSFDLDPNYSEVDLPSPLTPSYKVVRDTVSPRDMALGRPLTAGGTFSGYSAPSMLTGGSTCFKNEAKDCFCTVNTENWVVLDLESSMSIRKIIITGPALGDVEYFKAVTIRV